MSENRRRGVSPRSKTQPAQPALSTSNAAGRRVYDPAEPDAAEREVGCFRAEEAIANLAGNLPHWRQDGVTYFVTFRLADSLPKARLNEWLRQRDEWLVAHPKPWNDATCNAYHRRFTALIEKWLDAGHGSCLLARKTVRDVVSGALRHFDGSRYWLDVWVVMPTHVHVVVTPLPGHDLSCILHTWKSFTSHEIGAMLPDRSGVLWQKESFDHIIRNPDHLERIRAYIVRNPHGLSPDTYTLSCDIS